MSLQLTSASFFINRWSNWYKFSPSFCTIRVKWRSGVNPFCRTGSRLFFRCDRASVNSGETLFLHTRSTLISYVAGLKEPPWSPNCYLEVINCSHLIILDQIWIQSYTSWNVNQDKGETQAWLTLPGIDSGRGDYPA